MRRRSERSAPRGRPQGRARRATSARRRRWLGRAVVAASLLLAASAGADGYNDWSAELLDAGELSLVPAWQTQLSPQLGGYGQLQLQCGLGERFDLIAATAGWIFADRKEFDATLLQPRVQLLPGLLLSPGLAVQASRDGTPTSWLPGLFWTTQPAALWTVNVNAIGYLPVRAPTDADLFAVVVVQRQVGAAWGLYGELDYFGRPSRPGDQELVAFVGAEIEVGELDTLNVNLALPLAPALAPREIALGLWWAHSIQIDPLRWRQTR
jgi:hypothetical protein